MNGLRVWELFYESSISCKAFKTLILVFLRYLLLGSERQYNRLVLKLEDRFWVHSSWAMRLWTKLFPLQVSHQHLLKNGATPAHHEAVLSIRTQVSSGVEVLDRCGPFFHILLLVSFRIHTREGPPKLFSSSCHTINNLSYHLTHVTCKTPRQTLFPEEHTISASRNGIKS